MRTPETAFEELYPDTVFGMPRRMKELWPWVCAGAAHDNGDGAPLGELIAREPVPAEFAQMVADIASGKRRLPKKGKANQKVAPKERLELAIGLATIRELCDVIRTKGIGSHGGKAGAVSMADQQGVEPSEFIAEMHAERRVVTHDTAVELGVSVETVENITRDLYRRIKAWPTV